MAWKRGDLVEVAHGSGWVPGCVSRVDGVEVFAFVMLDPDSDGRPVELRSTAADVRAASVAVIPAALAAGKVAGIRGDMGYVSPGGPPTVEDCEREVARLRAAGWSQADFARALRLELTGELGPGGAFGELHPGEAVEVVSVGEVIARGTLLRVTAAGFAEVEGPEAGGLSRIGRAALGDAAVHSYAVEFVRPALPSFGEVAAAVNADKGRPAAPSFPAGAVRVLGVDLATSEGACAAALRALLPLVARLASAVDGAGLPAGYSDDDLSELGCAEEAAKAALRAAPSRWAGFSLEDLRQILAGLAWMGSSGAGGPAGSRVRVALKHELRGEVARRERAADLPAMPDGRSVL